VFGSWIYSGPTSYLKEETLVDLFIRLLKTEMFHFYDTPQKKLVKIDECHYIGPQGIRTISPTVLVVREKHEPLNTSIFVDKTKGDD